MVSLGPGDVDLVTIKALKALKNSNAICVPTKSSDNSFKKSLTYKTVSKLMSEHNFKKPLIPVFTPMHYRVEDWQNQVDILYKAVDDYKRVSFVTLGDSAIYSTVYYLLDIIKVQNPKLYCSSEVISGVTSFSEASARVKKPLCIGDSRLEIVPLIDKNLPKTTIYMRPKVGMDTAEISESGNIYTFENLNYKNEDITPYKKGKVTKYMTLFIDFFK
jgi:precorrin-2/cobalt-factor-2 C20-methyltransferase